MTVSKIILFSSVVLLTAIGVLGFFKQNTKKDSTLQAHKTIEVLAKRVEVFIEKPASLPKVEMIETTPVHLAISEESQEDSFPNVDRIDQLFRVNGTKIPIVETITYTSRVSWLKGRPAWIADYASYYNTSRHFIARSLNGKSDYFSQKVSTGSKFNVLRKDKNIHFYLLTDLSRCKMAFYYVDLDTKERFLIKTYSVGLGRLDSSKSSGCLTPMGTYSLGNRTAIYKPGTMGYFLDEKTEMIRIFGTRWIPFDQEIENCSEPSKGFGIHGAPWQEKAKTKLLVENRTCIGKYESDGSIRLAEEDIEELFSIVISKPTYLVIVKNFKEAKLPGVEVPL